MRSNSSLSRKSTENDLSNFVSAYREVREEFIGGRWSTFKSMLLRAIPFSGEFDRLLASEQEFQKQRREWLDGLLILKALSVPDLECMKCSLKNFKERIQSRRLFLELFATLLAIASTVYALLDQATHQKNSATLAWVSIGFLFFMLFERHQTVKEAGLVEECANVVDLVIKIQAHR